MTTKKGEPRTGEARILVDLLGSTLRNNIIQIVGDGEHAPSETEITKKTKSRLRQKTEIICMMEINA